jgi:hypothetical protein
MALAGSQLGAFARQAIGPEQVEDQASVGVVVSIASVMGVTAAW